MGFQNNSIYLCALFQCTNLTIGAKHYPNGISIADEAEKASGGGDWVLGGLGEIERRNVRELRGMGTRPCVRPRQRPLLSIYVLQYDVLFRDRHLARAR